MDEKKRLLELLYKYELIDHETMSRPDYDSDKAMEACAAFLLANGATLLPVKIGQTVYCIEYKTIHEGTVKSVKSLKDEAGTKFFVTVECDIEDPFFNDGRKTKHGISAVWEIPWGSWHRAFPSQEEAEKALAERRGNDGNV